MSIYPFSRRRALSTQHRLCDGSSLVALRKRSHFLVVILLISLSWSQVSRGDITVNAVEAGGNLTFSFNGSMNTMGVVPSAVGNGTVTALNLRTGLVDQLSFNTSVAPLQFNQYSPAQTGFNGVELSAINPAVGIAAPNSTSGDVFGFGGAGLLLLPVNYVDGTSISGSMTFNGTTAALLGLDLSTTLSFTTNFGDLIFFTLPVGNAEAIRSAITTGVFVPNAHAEAQKSLTSTALNALHNQRIVRARSRMGNPRTATDTLARADRHFGSYLRFAANQGITFRQAIGLEEIPASVEIDDSLDKPSRLLSVEVPAGKNILPGKAPLEESERWEVYTVGDFGVHDQSALDTVNRGFQSRTWAGSVGIEYLVSDSLNVGAAYTYAENDTDLDEGLGNVDIEGNVASVYATGFFDDKYVDILYSYGSYENDIRRNTLTAGGFALGNPDSDSHTVSVNAGQNFDLGDGLITGPTFGWDHTEGEIDAYNETGGGASALNYLSREYSSSITSVGWQVTKTKEVEAGIFSIQGFAAWEHEFSPEAGNVRASLTNSPFALNSSGAAPGTDWISLGVAALLACHNGLAISVDYQTQLFRDDVSAHYAGLKLSGEF
ncbi:MAG: autotransporter outer membrane beta-barrel domain-containing protein [Verrucomicrobiales bacterium]|nr:autotransporter outer membrane beta-barrel domain-containing protein [Verrucomicrobiales bacterium]